MIHEAIARSTIPSEHLAGLTGIEVTPERKVGMAGMGGTMGSTPPRAGCGSRPGCLPQARPQCRQACD